MGPDKYCIYLVPEIENASLGPVPDINNGDWDQSQRAILGIWDRSQRAIGTANYNVKYLVRNVNIKIKMIPSKIKSIRENNNYFYWPAVRQLGREGRQEEGVEGNN